MLVSAPAPSDALENLCCGGSGDGVSSGSSSTDESSAIVNRPRPPCRLSLSAAAPAAAPAAPSPLSPISANPCVAMTTVAAAATTVARKRRTCMGGFLCFSAGYPQHCESKTSNDPEAGEKTAAEPSGVSQGPTQVLSFLYVGSQADALDEDVIRRHGITHILNVSSSCPQSRHVPPDNFLRISVNDGYVDRLLPHFQQAFQFLENVRETSGRCLVHCLAGISRSPTLSIAYIMKHKKLSHEDAYRFVKEKRTNISPNFNFLGQLLEFEKQLKRSESFSEAASPSCGGGSGGGSVSDCWEAKRQRTTVVSSHSQPAGFLRPPPPPSLPASAQSPTTALSRLSFTPCASASGGAAFVQHHLPEFPGTSLEQVAVTPCRSAAPAAASASAPPTPPPPRLPPLPPPPPPPPVRTTSRRVGGGIGCVGQQSAVAASSSTSTTSSTTTGSTASRPRSVVVSATAAVRKSQSENHLLDDELDDHNLAATFVAAAAAAAAVAAVADSGRSRSLENLDACAASGGSMKSLSSSASNGSHGSQEILTYS